MSSSRLSATFLAVLKLTIGLSLLFGFLALVNWSALIQMQMPIVFMNPRTVHNMMLLEFVTSSPYLLVFYFLLFWAALTFSIVRKHPRWSRCLTFLAFLAPCLVYFNVCAYLSGKIWILPR